MVKYFCDVCGEEVRGSLIATCLDMVGKILCSEHYQKHQETMKKYGGGSYNNYTAPKPWETGYKGNMFDPNKPHETTVSLEE
jgi:hypothetical protein